MIIFELIVVAGHASLCLWVINVIHGFGLRETAMRRSALAVLAILSTWSIFFIRERISGDRAIAGYSAVCLFTAAVVVPAMLFSRASRKPPRGVTGMTRELGELLEDRPRGSGVNASMLRLPGNESLRLIRREWVIRRDEIPRPFDGLRILHISDLHFAPWYPRSFFERVSRAALDFGEPDLVLFTGDLVDDESTLDWLDTTLATLDARLGRFAILGNHDMKHRPGRVRRALRNAGYSVIDGKWARLSVDKATLAIGGTSAPWGPSLDLDEAPAADFRIVLSHTPDLFREFVGAGVELVFAGHTHGGQIRVPVLGPIVLPSRYGRRFDRGFFESGGTLMYVSQGVGGNHPIRFGCPPEISLMTLLAASGSESRRMHSSQRGEIRDSR